MDDVLLSYYNRELAYIRRLGADFAEQHPKIAGRLRLDKDVVEDPHVSRLIESFAFLTARIRHTIDDSFPELTEALMGLLYPDYHAPLPSMSIVQFRALDDVPKTSIVTRGRLLGTELTSRGRCYYRSCYDTQVLPIHADAAQFSNYPVKAPKLPANRNTTAVSQAVLKVSIHPFTGTSLNDIEASELRFYINAQPQIAFRLHEYLLNHVTGIAFARHPGDPDVEFFPGTLLTACGLDDLEAAIEFDGRTSTAHRLLAEYFAFPEKFLFVKLAGMNTFWDKFKDGFNLYIYFDQTHAELVQGVDSDTLMLGCSPVVNLFNEPIESIQASDVGIETKLRVSNTHTHCADIHSVKQVYANNSDGERITLKPFYGAHQHRNSDDSRIYWHLRRENSQWYGGAVSHGTDTYIAFVDENFKALTPDSHWIINADVLCTNRDLPNKLPFGPDQPRMDFMEGGAGLRIKCLTAPSATIQPKLDEATRWQLVTQLSLQNFMGEEGLLILKETLQLYDFQKTRESRSIVEGITGMNTQITTARLLQQGRSAICQGTHITIEFDESYYSGSGLYLFSVLLSEFFSQFCTINSFTELTIQIKQRPGSPINWPPRNGKQVLV
ncbi:MAG: type VI secretion system baseplate subunit TssF [Gammaproteobacteria bacterium]|nr:type VI secretion system baseplate subunit TssF [Gammaproteobacteria bacterium]